MPWVDLIGHNPGQPNVSNSAGRPQWVGARRRPMSFAEACPAAGEIAWHRRMLLLVMVLRLVQIFAVFVAGPAEHTAHNEQRSRRSFAGDQKMVVCWLSLYALRYYQVQLLHECTSRAQEHRMAARELFSASLLRCFLPPRHGWCYAMLVHLSREGFSCSLLVGRDTLECFPCTRNEKSKYAYFA